MIDTTPEISVIIPVYNVAHCLEKCLDSVLAQTFRNFELILVDDGSTDTSDEICDRYAAADRRIRVRHIPNGGVSNARNLGIEAAQGTWIVFIDSDDWVEPTYLSHLYDLRGDNRTIVYGNVFHDYPGTHRASAIAFNYPVAPKTVPLTDGDAMAHYLIPENGYPIAKLFNREIIAEKGLRFDPSISYHEDHIFVLSYLELIDKIVLSEAADYHYMHHSGGQSLSKRHHSPRDLILASQALLSLVDRCTARWSTNAGGYFNRLYTCLGLNQLMLALIASANRSDYNGVCNVIRKEYGRFKRHYTPNHRILKTAVFLINYRFTAPIYLLLKWRKKLISM